MTLSSRVIVADAYIVLRSAAKPVGLPSFAGYNAYPRAAIREGPVSQIRTRKSLPAAVRLPSVATGFLGDYFSEW
jgi:hypothetical protein